MNDLSQDEMAQRKNGDLWSLSLLLKPHCELGGQSKLHFCRQFGDG